jgi:hypothetical protein
MSHAPPSHNAPFPPSHAHCYSGGIHLEAPFRPSTCVIGDYISLIYLYIVHSRNLVITVNYHYKIRMFFFFIGNAISRPLLSNFYFGIAYFWRSSCGRSSTHALTTTLHNRTPLASDLDRDRLGYCFVYGHDALVQDKSFERGDEGRSVIGNDFLNSSGQFPIGTRLPRNAPRVRHGPVSVQRGCYAGHMVSERAWTIYR